MQKYEPIGLKTMDGKEIMTYTKEYYFTYVKPRLEKSIRNIWTNAYRRSSREGKKEAKKKAKTKYDQSFFQFEEWGRRTIYKHNSINKKHDKLFKEMLSNKKKK